MHADASEKRLATVREAMSRGDWSEAEALLRQLDPDARRTPVALELLANATYGAGDLEAALTAWEELYALHERTGDAAGAAHAAVMTAMYLMMDTGLMAPVRGWLARADRLLADLADGPSHALLAMVRMYERFVCGDSDGAREWSARAVRLGDEHEVLPAATLGRVAAARVRIYDGDIETGLQELDEVAVSLLSGELDPLATGMVYCELICAMQGLAEYERAAEWTEAMERWRRGAAFGGINGRCRVHRAEMLRLHGPCDEAEAEALRACEELRPWMRREYGWPLTELGTIRLRKGDLAGAEEAFLAAHHNAWEPQPGLARVRLAQGDVDGAVTLIAAALERPDDIPSKERPPFGPLRRAPLLDAQAEIALAAGDMDTARRASDELAGIAATFGSRALMAVSHLAEARLALASGDVESAVAAASRSVAAWADVGAPYETGSARLVLAEALQRCGNDEQARLERQAALSAFESIGAQRRAAEAADALAGRAGGSATAASGARPRRAEAVFRCEGDTRRLMFDGTSVLLRDLVGMRYLERLLAEPDREFHVLDLVAVEQGVIAPAVQRERDELAVGLGDAGLAIIDEQARAAYKRRLAEVEEDIVEAERMNDPARADLARRDRDYLVQELSRAVGLAGRPRETGGSAERARSSVTRSIRYALGKIVEHHPGLGAHLEATIRTGTYCAYEPDPRAPVVWTVRLDASAR